MLGPDDNGADARQDGGDPRARAIVVAGRSSQRTRDVLNALSGFANVIWPASPKAALEHVRANDTACLIITDELAAESVDEILQFFRERLCNLPIFVITDPDDVAEAVSAMRHGATAVIEIPPSYGMLRSEVTRAMQ